MTSPSTMESIQTRKVIFLDGVNEPFKCALKKDCPLNSVLVIPLQVDGELIGTIQLFESKSKRFLNINKSFGEGLVSLLSTQLFFIAKYADQKTLLVESELKLLHAQINPHFLFNTLNTILSVTRVSPDKAIELIQHLSNMFRKNLKRQHLTSRLDEDLDHVNSYLVIEKARFEKHLNVKIDIDPSLMHIKIPSFTLQPLLENAIKHGMSNVMGGLEIVVRGYRDNLNAVIEVQDNAGSFDESVSLANSEGLGLAIVDKRIKKSMWGGQSYGLEVSCVKGELTTVKVTVPINEAGIDV